MPHFKAYLVLSIFLTAAYFGYRHFDNAPITRLNPEEEKPPTSKPWPWQARRQPPQIQPDSTQPDKTETLNATIPFGNEFPDFYAKFNERAIDDLGQDWDDGNDEVFAKYESQPDDLQIEPLTDLGQNWDN